MRKDCWTGEVVECPAESLSGTMGTQSYDAGGDLAAEYEALGSGAASPCTTCYVTGDHFGSTRALWDEAGLKTRYDYLPFGEAVARDRNGRGSLQCAAGVATCYDGPSGVAQRFTGKERDGETGLDYFEARYMSGAQGRFISPDPVFMTKARVYDPQQWNQYAYVRNNPMIHVDPDGRELRLAVYNSSQYSREAVQRAANIVVSRLRSAGVQNVSSEVRQGVPSAGDQARQGLVGLLGFVTGSQHSHMAEVRSSRKGEGLLNSGIKEGEAGRNFNGSSAVDASQVQRKAGDEDKAVVGLADLMTHELGHDVFVGHSESPDNAMFGSASADWLFNPNLTFSRKQASALRKRFNTEEEERQAEKEKERKQP